MHAQKAVLLLLAAAASSTTAQGTSALAGVTSAFNSATGSAVTFASGFAPSSTGSSATSTATSSTLSTSPSAGRAAKKTQKKMTPTHHSKPTQTSSHSSGLSAGAIAGIVVGCVVGVGLILGLALCFCCAGMFKKGNKKAEEEDSPRYSESKEPERRQAPTPAPMNRSNPQQTTTTNQYTDSVNNQGMTPGGDSRNTFRPGAGDSTIHPGYSTGNTGGPGLASGMTGSEGAGNLARDTNGYTQGQTGQTNGGLMYNARETAGRFTGGGNKYSVTN